MSKLDNAVNEIIEFMSLHNEKQNIYLLKLLVENYGKKCKVSSTKVAKELFDEFMDDKIEIGDELNFKHIEKEEEKLITKQDTLKYYFQDCAYGKMDITHKIFAQSLYKDIFSPFVKSHEIEYAHKYAPQQTKI